MRKQNNQGHESKKETTRKVEEEGKRGGRRTDKGVTEVMNII
jgi:hypothetical protein